MTVIARSTTSSTGRTAGALALAVIAAAVGANVANTVISVIARGAGVSDDLQPLWPSSYLALTVVGILAGAIGWQVVRSRATDPAAVLRWLVPAVIALSIVPDVALGVAASSPGVSWGGVLALILMHLSVAVVAIPIYRRFLPLV